MPVRMLFTVLVFVSAIFIMRSSAQAPAASGPFVAGEITDTALTSPARSQRRSIIRPATQQRKKASPASRPMR